MFLREWSWTLMNRMWMLNWWLALLLSFLKKWKLEKITREFGMKVSHYYIFYLFYIIFIQRLYISCYTINTPFVVYFLLLWQNNRCTTNTNQPSFGCCSMPWHVCAWIIINNHFLFIYSFRIVLLMSSVTFPFWRERESVCFALKYASFHFISLFIHSLYLFTKFDSGTRCPS